MVLIALFLYVLALIGITGLMLTIPTDYPKGKVSAYSGKHRKAAHSRPYRAILQY